MPANTEHVEKINFISDIAHLTPKQVMALEATVSRREPFVLVGGAGFGGKSHLLRAFCVWFLGQLRKAGYPGQRVTLSTLSYESLRDRHILKLEQEYGPQSAYPIGEFVRDDKLDGRCFKFYDPSMGAIRLRNAKDPGERKGSEVAALAHDELTELTQEQWGELSYTVRSPLPLPWLVRLAGSNPDGIGHSWVKRIWRPQLSAEMRKVPFPAGRDEKLRAADYIYIPFLPDDNPAFDEDRFWADVAHLPEHIQRARRYGLWDAPEGARWPFLNPEIHLFDPERSFPQGVPAGWVRIAHVDYGLRAPYCCLWTAIDHDRNAWTYREDYTSGLDARSQAERIRDKTGPSEVVRAIYPDPSMWNRLPGYEGPTEKALIDDYIEILGSDKRFGGIIPGFNRSRVHALGTLDKMLARNNHFPDWHISIECVNLWLELTAAVWDKRGEFNDKKEDIDERCADHAITASYYGLHTHYESPKAAKEDGLTAERIAQAMQKRRDDIDAKQFRSFTKRRRI